MDDIAFAELAALYFRNLANTRVDYAEGILAAILVASEDLTVTDHDWWVGC